MSSATRGTRTPTGPDPIDNVIRGRAGRRMNAAANHRGGPAISRPHMIGAPRPRRNLASLSNSLSRTQKGLSRSLSHRNTARIAPT